MAHGIVSYCFFGGAPHAAVCRRECLTAGGGAGLKHVNGVCKTVFSQLQDLSLEEMGIETVENIVWKSAEGLKNQMWAYSLMGAFDAAVSHYLPKILDGETSARSCKAVTNIISSQDRLRDFLHGASRVRALKGLYLLSMQVTVAEFAHVLSLVEARGGAVCKQCRSSLTAAVRRCGSK